MIAIDRISIDDAEALRIGRAGDVVLKTEHRGQLCKVLETFVWLQRGKSAQLKPNGAAMAKHLAAIIRCLHPFSTSLRDPQGKFDQAIAIRYQGLFEIAGIDPERFLGELVALQALNDLVIKDETVRHRPADVWVKLLLKDLDRIYRDAGGGSTGIVKDDADKRQSRFIEFVSAAVELLPGDLRPGGFQALAARWERIRQKRDKDEVNRSSKRYLPTAHPLWKVAPSISKLEPEPQTAKTSASDLLDDSWFETRPLQVHLTWWAFPDKDFEGK